MALGFLCFVFNRMTHSWLLPDYIADILPSAAARIEKVKEQMLSLFHSYGYHLVIPPLMEYTQSLLTNIDPDLSLKTIRIADRFSGRQLGLRADITPQISRIDAHLLSANDGINRLCYAGTVLHASPDTLYSTREPLQIGAEMYGFDDIGADNEIITLMLKSLAILGVENPLLSLAHIKIFNILSALANLSVEDKNTLRQMISNKEQESVQQFCTQKGLPENLSSAFAALPVLYGEVPQVLQQAQKILPSNPDIQAAFNDLNTVYQQFVSQYRIHLDLSELRADNYHSGLLFASYRDDESEAIARGGRYDGLGRYFGRERPSVGFSLDLKNFLELLPQHIEKSGICVKPEDLPQVSEMVNQLRLDGEMVIVDYIGAGAAKLNCNRTVAFINNQWQVIGI